VKILSCLSIRSPLFGIFLWLSHELAETRIGAEVVGLALKEYAAEAARLRLMDVITSESSPETSVISEDSIGHIGTGTDTYFHIVLGPELRGTSRAPTHPLLQQAISKVPLNRSG
jgi:hypothetical protein